MGLEFSGRVIKIIHLRRDMVIQVFGIRSGSVPFPLDSTDPVVVARVLQLRSQYLGNGQKNIQFYNIITIMKNDETEEGFMRSFLFLFISSVFCPTTRNCANWKILYGLHNISKLKTLDLAQLCIDHLNKEIDNFSTNLFNRTETPLNNSIYVGGCLPLAVIVYLDFVDFTKASQQRSINYGVPRMAYILNDDFDYLATVDLNPRSKKTFALGFLPLKDISMTPYGARAIVLAQEKWSKAPQSYVVEENLIPKSNDISNVASTSNSNPEVMNIISQVVAKHDEICKKLHEHHMENMFSDLKTTLMSLQPNTISQVNIAGTSTMNPIVLSARSNMNNQNEPINSNHRPVQIVSEPIRASLFQDHVQVTPTPEVTLMHSSKDIQLEKAVPVTEQDSVPRQVQQTEQAPSVVNIVQNEEISPGNNGTFSETIHTRPISVLQPVDCVQHAVNSEPYEMEFQHVNPTTVHIQETPVSVSKQTQLVNEPPMKEVSASSNILTEDAIMLRNVISQSNDNLGDGIEIAMKYADDIIIPELDKTVPKGPVVPEVPEHKSSHATLNISGPSTIEKRNRKKRKAKDLCAQDKISKISVEPHVQEFYKKYLGNKFFKNENPTIIDINGFTVEYNHFYNSLKAIGNVHSEVFNAYVQVFNYENENLDPKSKEPLKYCFTSYFTEKLLDDPKNFDSRSCVREFKKLNCGKNLHTRDMIINMGTILKSSGCTYKNIENLDCISPEEYPQQDNLHNCALYAIMYMDIWDGKNMKEFDDGIIPQFRQVIAYKLAKCDINDKNVEGLEDDVSTKKRKKRR
ncbi:hypothetical protein ACQJBY_032580 [Aegilops geniculata]